MSIDDILGATPGDDSKSQPTRTVTAGIVGDDAYRKLLADLLAQKTREVYDLLGQAIKIFLFYFAITLAMLKFSLDAQATPSLARMLSVFGCLQSVGALVGIWFAHRIRESYEADIANLSEKLQLAESTSITRMMQAAIGFAGMGIVVTGCGWIYILLEVAPHLDLFKSSGPQGLSLHL